jgi:chitin synthase
VASHRTGLSAATGSNQVSTQTLLTSLHTAYSAGKPYTLDASTSLVVNTWVSAGVEGPDGSLGGTVDAELAQRVWEHARRRAEDGCVILGYL